MKSCSILHLPPSVFEVFHIYYSMQLGQGWSFAAFYYGGIQEFNSKCFNPNKGQSYR